MQLRVPDASLVVLIGPSGAGKTTFAATRFRPTEVISSDACRALVSDDENDQSATRGAFRLVRAIARERLRAGKLTVIDATSVRPESRRPLLTLALRLGRTPIAVVFDLPERLCIERNEQRRHRAVPPRVVHRQWTEMRRSLSGLGEEGFGEVYVLDSPEAVEAAIIVRA
jgi:predicted kinase